jgi:tetratricopeptide (TPR) repeat protein
MAAGSRSSGCGICPESANCRRYNKKVNQLSGLVAENPASGVRRLLCFLLLVLTSLSAVAQAPDAERRTLVHGLIVTAEGQPVARATVEVRDLRGLKMAAGVTDSAGSFAITTLARPGEYFLVATKALQIGDERIRLDQPDREVTVALPRAWRAAAAPSGPMYTVSAEQLSVPAKTRAHLMRAQQMFSKSELAGADREIDQALQLDRSYAPAFSMRALLRLALRDFNGAVRDATRALALDSGEAGAYLALATAHNSLGEFPQAEAAAQQALGMSLDFWQGRLELAKAFYGEGRLVLGLRELDELNKDFPDVHLVRANILVRLNRGEEAAGEFREFLREAPNDPRRQQIEDIVSRAGGAAAPPAASLR